MVGAAVLSRRVPTILPVVVGAAVLLASAAAVAAGYGLYVLALLLVIPVVVAIFFRPQRGVLLVAAGAPFTGLLLILPFPSFVAGWKEAKDF